MKWFDTKEIKAEATLSPEQITYLREPSITFLAPLNALFRRQWDLLFVLVVIEDLLYPVSIFILLKEIPGSTFAMIAGDYPSYTFTNPVFLFFQILQWILNYYILYFGVIHGRRLSWNRNRWASFEAFQESEAKWKPWGWFGAGLIALGVISTLYSAIALLITH